MRARLQRSLRHAVGVVNLRRWPWPKWKLAGGDVTLPIGEHSFRFRGIDRPELMSLAHAAHRRTWEQPMIQELSRALSTGDVFFDRRLRRPYSLLASRLVGPEGRVVAFESDARARAVLQGNLDANGVTNVTVSPLALGDHDGPVSFFGSADAVGHLGEGGDIEVDMTTLDAFCGREGLEPDVMNMDDIEGGEGAALRASVVARRIREIVLEVHEPELRAQSLDPKQLLASLGEHRAIEPPDGGNYAVVITPGA